MKRLSNGRVVYGDTPITDPATGLTEARVNAMINGAMARFAKDDLPKSFEALNAQFATLGTAIQALSVKKEEPPPPAPEPGKKGAMTPEVAAQVNSLLKQVEALTLSQKTESDARKTAEERAIKVDTESQVRASLSGFNFVNESAANDAFNSVLSQVTRTDSGQIIANDLPLGDFVADYLPNQKPYFLQPVRTGGSGATGGGTSRSGVKQVGLEDIKLGASNETLANAAGQIRELLANS